MVHQIMIVGVGGRVEFSGGTSVAVFKKYRTGCVKYKI